ncbi:MAG: capsular biosynthesis protein [Planctomycetota bacterium]|jgi:hypothetical protein
MKKTVCVDLDGTLAQYSEWEGLENIGDPIPGARSFLQALKELGCEVVIYTTRTNPDVNQEEGKYDLALRIHTWLEQNEMPCDSVYVGRGKPIASAYVDDRAVECRPQDVIHADKTGAFTLALRAVERLIK